MLSTHRRICALCTLLICPALVPGVAHAQQPARHAPALDLGVNYVAQRTNYSFGDNLWMHGASADASYALWKPLSVAANFTGVHCNGNFGEASLGILSFAAGPRVTYGLHDGRFTPHMGRVKVYGEALFGVAHGFDSVFPSGSSVQSSANSFTTQLGGAVEFGWRHGFALRLAEVDYVHTSLSNGSTNAQNQLRLGAGVLYHLPMKRDSRH